MGESLFWVSSHLFSHAGAHILFVFLLLAGVLLLTGASVAGVVSATRQGVATTTERVRVSKQDLAQRTLRSHLGAARAPHSGEPVAPPEPEDSEPVVRATHVEAPALDGVRALPRPVRRRGRPEEEEEEEQRSSEPEPWSPSRFPEPEPLPLPVAAEPEPRRSPRSPRRATGARRSPSRTTSTTGCRSTSFLKRSNGAQKVDTKGIERAGGQLVEALSHFNVDGAVIGTVTGPHVTRYELRLAPGIKMSKVATLKDDLAYALAAEQVRILAPIPGKQAVGVEVPNRVRKMVHLGDVFQEAPERLVAAVGLARQGHRRQGDRHRPRQAAAHPHRRHHRLRKVGLRERDALLGPAALLAERAAAWCSWTRSGWS